MKNSTLLFRSLAIIIFITGSAHLVTYASANLDYFKSEKQTEEKIKVTISEKEEQSTNSETDYIIGKWKVSYKTKEYKGAIVYEIKRQGKVYNAYTYEYQDEEGFAEKDEGTMSLIIKTFNGYKGRGVYKVEYEGQEYDVKCEINRVDENTFKLSYDYYGYRDVETWQRL